MPLQVPVLDDLNFERLLEEAKRRIPSFTPEWTNYGVESDPGITLVQLFAFLTDALAYRANRIPERDRLKFLQLLGIPLQPATPATGIVAIGHQRAPLEPLPLNPGVALAAGKQAFQTLDGINVLPLEGRVYYKEPIAETDPRREEFLARHEALRLAEEAAAEAAGGVTSPVTLAFYQPRTLTLPTAAEPSPLLDLATTLDKALYLALLAPAGADPNQVREAIARQTLSLGLVPAVAGDIDPLAPQRLAAATPQRRLVFELPGNPEDGDSAPVYHPLRPLAQPDLEARPAVVQLPLPEAGALRTWRFADPLREGVDDFPPRLEDDRLATRLVTWIRCRISASQADAGAPPALRLTWVGLNATRVVQAVTVTDELLGLGNGEPDQGFTLANTPVVAGSLTLIGRGPNGALGHWRRTNDLLAAGPDDPVFELDPEAGAIRFGNGLRGARPARDLRLFATYRHGGGPAGNVAIGAINGSRDPRLKGGFRIENPIPTSGGAAGETVADGERNIPRVVRHRQRLVTRQDYRDIALRAAGVDVGRVEVLPLYRPTVPAELDAAGSVTLLAIPRIDPLAPLWPTPDRLFLRRLCDYLDERRLITTEIHVRGPDYVPLYLTLGIRVRGDFFADAVRGEVRRRLEVYLSSLPPGGADGRGWALRKPVLAKDLEAVASRVAGVEYVEALLLGETGPVQREHIDLTGLRLPLLAAIEVSIGAAPPLEALVAETPPPPLPGVAVVPVPVIEETC